MSPMPSAIAVFCGSSFGDGPVFAEAARAVGRALAERGIHLVYGGGHVGLMGTVADAALEAGGTVTGVIPRTLHEREHMQEGLTELLVVETMHERKAKMAELADAFIALPGGPGTLEEITEQWTWAQLGIHEKPCGFLDVDGYFAPLREFVGNMRDRGFTHPRYTEMLIFAEGVDELLSRMGVYAPPARSASTPGHEMSTPRP